MTGMITLTKSGRAGHGRKPVADGLVDVRSVGVRTQVVVAREDQDVDDALSLPQSSPFPRSSLCLLLRLRLWLCGCW